MTSAVDPLVKSLQPVIVSLIFLSLLVTGCSRSEEPEILEFTGQTMGTWYSVKVSDLPASLSPEEVASLIKSQVEDINNKMSTYKPESELSLFNKTPINTPYSLSAETFQVLLKSVNIWRESMGAFDITIGPLVNVWGFGPDGSSMKIPDQAKMAAAWGRVGTDGLTLDREKRTLLKSKDLYLDLSAIAKGYAVDQVAAALEQAGVQRYLIELGGELRAGESKASNLPWQVAVEEPETHLRKVHTVIPLDNVAMATSGDYRNFFEQDGKRFSHTIDPRTGRPVEHSLVSVSVIMPQCADADGWATAMMVLGPEQGMELAETKKLAVYMILKSEQGFEVRYSQAFASYLSR